MSGPVASAYWSELDARHCAERATWATSLETTPRDRRLGTSSQLLTGSQLKPGRNRSTPGGLG